MSDAPQKVLFVDRDGTLIEEPPDEQVDSLDKIRFMPDVFASLQQLAAAGYRLVMVTNQDGLGTASFPREQLRAAAALRDRHARLAGHPLRCRVHLPAQAADGCDCRKPKLGLVKDYLRSARTSTSPAAW